MKEPISFDQLHINAVTHRFVSADEMKFLILVDKLCVDRGPSKNIRQAIIREIETEFPNYTLPKSHNEGGHYNKLAELRELFRLPEFRTHFNKKDFEEARNKAREAQGFPAENIQTRKGSFDLFLHDIKKEGRWTTQGDAGQLWKQLPEDTRSKYEEKAENVKQEIAKFEENKLPQLLNDPKQFYWLLRVSFNHYR